MNQYAEIVLGESITQNRFSNLRQMQSKGSKFRFKIYRVNCQRFETLPRTKFAPRTCTTVEIYVGEEV